MAQKRKLAFWLLPLLMGAVVIIVTWFSTSDLPSVVVKGKKFSKFPGLFEPSGVAQLQDGRILVIEDEPSQPFSLLTYQQSSNTLTLSVLQSASLIDKFSNPIDDLEGIALGPNEQIYAITSHSRKMNGKRSRKREQLIRFEVAGNKQFNVQLRTDLRKKLTAQFPVLATAAKKGNSAYGLNIEGLSFDKNNDKLLIAFRSPLVDGKAILVEMLNPETALSTNKKIRFADELVLLDLDRGGIRDIVYDPNVEGYLLISQREGTKKEKPFKLWFWSGNSQLKPQRIHVRGIKNLRRVEGIASVSLNGVEKLLLLSDDGLQIKGQPAKFALVDYDQLDIDNNP